MPRTHPPYPSAFRAEAVRLVQSSGKSIPVIANGRPRILDVTVHGGWRGRGRPCSTDCVPESVPHLPGRDKSGPYRVAMTTHHEARRPPPTEPAHDRAAHGMEEEDGVRYRQLPTVRRD